MYNFILKYPGLNRSELSRKMNIPYTTLKYHLVYLKKRGFLLEKNEDKYVRYYVAKEVSRRDKEIFNLLRQDVPLRIVILLLYTRPCYWYPEINHDMISSASYESMVTFSKDELVEMERCCENTDLKKIVRNEVRRILPDDSSEVAKLHSLRKHRTTIDFHLNKLLEADIIEKVPSGKEMRYRLKDPTEIYIFLTRHKQALSSKIVDFAVPYIKGGIDQAIDIVIEILFDIFPHPYHA